jgi:hypothetical protein
VVTTETHPEFASRDTIAVAAGIFSREPIEAMPYSIFHHEFSDVIPCYHHYAANRDNIAKSKYDGFSIGVHFVDFVINKFQDEKRWYP